MDTIAAEEIRCLTFLAAFSFFFLIYVLAL